MTTHNVPHDSEVTKTTSSLSLTYLNCYFTKIKKLALKMLSLMISSSNKANSVVTVTQVGSSSSRTNEIKIHKNMKSEFKKNMISVMMQKIKIER